MSLALAASLSANTWRLASSRTATYEPMLPLTICTPCRTSSSSTTLPRFSRCIASSFLLMPCSWTSAYDDTSTATTAMRLIAVVTFRPMDMSASNCRKPRRPEAPASGVFTLAMERASARARAERPAPPVDARSSHRSADCGL